MDSLKWGESKGANGGKHSIGLATYRLIFDSIQHFAGLLTPEGILLEANAKSLEYIQKKREDVIGHFFWETEWWTHDSALQKELRQAIKRANQKKETIHFLASHANSEGEIEDFEFTITPLLDNHNEVLFLIPEGRNITDIRIAQKQRDDSEVLYRDLFDKSDDAYLVIEGNEFIDCNYSAVNMLGYNSRKELFKIHPSELSPPFQPDGSPSFELANERMAEAYRDGKARFEWIHKRVDGSLFPVEVLLTPIRRGASTVLFTVWRDITQRKKDEKELQALNYNLEDQVKRRTEELENSLEALKIAQHDLLQSQKLASLGELVAGMSHEVSTPVGIGVTSASYIEMELKELLIRVEAESISKAEFSTIMTDLLDSSKTLMKNLMRASEMIGSFKRVALNQSNDNLEIIELETYLKEIVESVGSLLKRSGHQILLNIPSRLKIRTYPGALSHVITNLIMNSLQHGFRDLSNGVIRMTVIQEKDGLKFIYQDNGIGISRDKIEKVFDPFFTTRRSSGNTGMGLNVVYTQVTQTLKGHITVTSEINEGIQFEITLPYLRYE